MNRKSPQKSPREEEPKKQEARERTPTSPTRRKTIFSPTVEEQAEPKAPVEDVKDSRERKADALEGPNSAPGPSPSRSKQQETLEPEVQETFWANREEQPP